MSDPHDSAALKRIEARLALGDERMARIEALLIGDISGTPGLGERLRILERERATRLWVYAILGASIVTDLGTRLWAILAPSH